jgi:hypothetical protein
MKRRKVLFVVIWLVLAATFALILARAARAEDRPPDPELIYLPYVIQTRWTPPMPTVSVVEAQGELANGTMHIITVGPGCSDVWIQIWMNLVTYQFAQDGNLCDSNGVAYTTIFIPSIGEVYRVGANVYYASWLIWPRLVETYGSWIVTQPGDMP